jgi:DNA-binding CsgD family transcriptional regulator
VIFGLTRRIGVRKSGRAGHTSRAADDRSLATARTFTQETTMSTPRCATHPDSNVRRFRANGPGGPGVYPQCVPTDGSPPHLLGWSDDRSGDERGLEITISRELAPSSVLSPSELQVLCAAANGLTSIESGRRLAKGVETIKTQRHQILLKLGARNVTQAVCIATEQGFLVVDRERARSLHAA